MATENTHQLNCAEESNTTSWLIKIPVLLWSQITELLATEYNVSKVITKGSTHFIRCSALPIEAYAIWRLTSRNWLRYESPRHLCEAQESLRS